MPSKLHFFSFASSNPLSVVKKKRIILFFILIFSILVIETVKGPSWVQAQGTVFVVNSTADIDDETLNDGICKTEDPLPDGSDQCTLRAAIRQANATPALDVIWFNIPTTAAGYDASTGSFNIYPSMGPLPRISSPLEIDGYSQPGAVKNSAGIGTDATLKIVINGSFLPPVNGLGTIGLDITARDSLIQGLVINSFSRAGIYLRGGFLSLGDPPGVQVLGNFIGTDVTGYVAMPNNTGIDVAAASDNTRIGGTAAEDRNLISGNSYNGVAIGNGEATGNVVQGNLIGTDRTGQSALPNEYVGVLISSSAGFSGVPSFNTIGGTAPGAGNVISGNGRAGVEIFTGNNNAVIGNYIGSDSNKSMPIPNGIGVHLLNKAEDNAIGGPLQGEGNYIANNLSDGILISDNATNNGIFGNHITLNQKNGIYLKFATNTVIGGDTIPEEANTIEENLQAGILLEGARNNEIKSNNILNNVSDGLALISNSENNQIQGSQTGALVIGGNQWAGIRIKGSNGNTIEGAFIGNDGFNVNPNVIGILIVDGSSGNIIGGDTPQERNIISGNATNGIEISGAETTENKIQGNYIGPDVSGLAPMQHSGNGDPVYGNTVNGILIKDGATLNMIGGVGAEGNLISGNSGNGITLEGSDTGYNLIQSNIIGGDVNKACTEDSAGDCSMGNGGYGVLIREDSHHNIIGSLAGNKTNTIAYNGYTHDLKGHGIQIESGVSNTIRGNSIFDNQGRGINLVTPAGQPNAEYAFTINDYKDKDGGPNNLQNYPIVNKVQFSGGQKTIEWQLNSTPQTQFVVEIYANDELDPSGFGEGKTLLYTKVLDTNEFGQGLFSYTTSTANTFIAATVTSPDGSTSEFSIVDTDGDALADAWETAGMGLNINEDSNENGDPVIDLDLAALGANPQHKDLFVEIDAMAGLAPSQAVLDMVSFGRSNDEGFANAPAALVNNPDGGNGINLHFETDPTEYLIPRAEWTESVDDKWPPEFFTVKNSYFGNPADRDPTNPNSTQVLSAKRLVFRYGLFANNIGPNKTSGIGELGGNDFIVSLGRWTDDAGVSGGTDLDKAGTLMHELGHTLGLLHGGLDSTNCKPNYHSVMNYTWQTPYNAYLSSWQLNYSDQLFFAVDENAVDTINGFGGHAGHRVPIGPMADANGTPTPNFLVDEAGALPADLVEGADPNNPFVGPRDISFILNTCLSDTNKDGAKDYQDTELTVLTPAVDWDRLIYSFHASKHFADGIQPSDVEIEEITLEDVEALNAIGSGPGQIQFSRALAQATELDGFVTISVVRAGGTDGVVTVDYATTGGGTATAGVDFTAVSGTLTFPDLVHVQTFTVPVNLDAATENLETIEIGLSNPGGGSALGTYSTLSVNLYDDQEPGIITFASDLNFAIENSGQAAVELVRTGGQYGAVSVTFSTIEDSAVAGSDYSSVNQTVTFAHGEVNKTVYVPLIDDTEFEITEFINVSISNPTNGAQIGDRDMAQVHILDDEYPNSTYIVTTTADSGPGSLRQAIASANTHIGLDVILFDIPGSGVHTISPLTKLPDITSPVIIDGFSQSGASPNTLADSSNAILLIELDGSNLYHFLDNGLDLDADDSVIRGLVINNFPANGIQITGNNNLIEGNYIGTDPTGTEDRGNRYTGIRLSNGSGHQIGGGQPESRNIISGNGQSGISNNYLTDSTIIQGNFIGVMADGISPLGNDDHGLVMIANATVGGLLPGQGNIIAYNEKNGIIGPGAERPVILGNSIYNNQGWAYESSLSGTNPGLGVRTNVLHEADEKVNFPTLPSATYQDGYLVIVGRLDYSRPNTEYLIQFYANDTIEPSGFGEGKLFLGAVSTTTDSDGDAEFTFRMPGTLPPGRFVTATATDFDLGTSEFGGRLAVGDTPTEVAVVNTLDDGDDGVCDTVHCSLREAIFNANNHGGVSYIHFNIGSGHQTIQPLTPLPHMSGPTIIDGTSQPGFAGSPIIELSGDQLTVPLSFKYGLWLVGGDSQVRGLVINQFSTGIRVGNGSAVYEGIGGNIIQGNYIGTDVTGLIASGNGTGVGVSNTPDNLIGGTNPVDRNILSGNLYGVGIGSSIVYTNNVVIELQGNGNVVQGNYIGLDATGTLPLGNTVAGIGATAANVTIGGSEPGAGNVIAGNETGIRLQIAPLGGENLIQGNMIGTDPTGKVPIGNSSSGIFINQYNSVIYDSTLPSIEISNNLIAASGDAGIQIFASSNHQIMIKHNYIGTDIDGIAAFPNNIGIEVSASNNVIEDNLISGNQSHGIYFYTWNQYAETFNNAVTGNLIGVQADGILPMSNGGDGVLIDEDAYNTTIEDNTIANNAGNGVGISDASTGNTLLTNTIYSNGGLGIDLGLNGVSFNDNGDGDSGANGLQNYPVVVAAESGPAVTVVTVALNSTAATTYTIELYSSDTADLSGYGEGQQLLTQFELLTDANGTRVAQVLLAGDLPLGTFVSATATDASGQTSEFSAAVPVNSMPQPNPETEYTSASDLNVVEYLDNAPPVIDFGGPYSATEGQDLILDGGSSFAIGSTITTYAWDLDNDGQFNDASGATAVFNQPDNGLATVGLQVTDANGQTAAAVLTLSVINDVPAVDAGPDQQVDLATNLILTASFNDSGVLDTHTATINWGEGITETAVVNQASQTVSGSHVYNVEGTYQAQVCVTDSDGETGCDDVLLTVAQVDRADLVITQSDSADPVGVGEVVTHFVVVDNLGPTMADDVDVLVEMSAGVVVQDFSTSQGSCLDFDEEFVCFLGDMLPGSQVVLEFEIYRNSTGYIVVYSEVDSRTNDPDFSNNDDSEFTQVINNQAPAAVDDSFNGVEDTPLVIDVLTNDSDGDGDPLSVTAVVQPANGMVVINSDNTITYTPDADYNLNDSAGGPDTFSYTVSDGISSASATVAITVSPVNDNPAAVDDTVSTNEDTAVSLNPLANDNDVDGDVVTITAIGSPVLGSLIDNGDGTYTYTPAANIAGSDTFSYTVEDGSGGTAAARVTVTVVPVNDVPVAQNDSAVVDEDSTVLIPVLDNDSDIDGDALQVTAVNAPSNGTVVDNGDGTITYSPAANFNGSDSFTYTASDGQGGMSTAAVQITVNPVNDLPVAQEDSAAVLEDTQIVLDVLANDSDVDGDALTVSITIAPQNGTAVVNGDGTITYTPGASFNGTDTLTYGVDDGNGGTDTALVTLNVTPGNDNPEAMDDEVTTAEDTAVVIDVLANDGDVDGDPLTITAVTTPTSGLVAINPAPSTGSGQATLTYTPTQNFSGDASFVYTVGDGFGGSDTALVTIHVTPVNDDPTAAGDSATTSEDTAVTLDVLANDADVDGDVLGVKTITTPAHGTAIINLDGTITYQPSSNFNGSDSLDYTVSDGFGGQATATLNLTVVAVNDEPLAVDDMGLTTEDTAVAVAVLNNDSDVDGDSLFVTNVTLPGHGTARIEPNNTIVYTPTADFNGADSFSYTIDDGNGGTNSATVYIAVQAVNDNPVAANDSVMIDEDMALTIDILVNDSDVDGDSLVVSSVSAPANGTVTNNPDGSLFYSPAANFNGTDSFGYVVEDGNGGSDTAVVTIIVNPVNDSPTAADDAILTPEDTAVTVDVLANDSDVDGDVLTVMTVMTPTYGTLVVNLDSTVTYTPALEFSGVDSFDYTIVDGFGGTDTATVTITVSSENDNPVAATDGAATDEDTAVNIAVLSNDSDIDGDVLSVSSLTQPANGAVTANSDGTVTYTPEADYYGEDSFIYTVSDGHGGSDTAVVTVTVQSVNDAPVAIDDSAVTAQDTAVTVPVLLNDSDIEGDLLTVSGVGTAVYGTVTLNPDGTITYLPDPGFFGTDSFSYNTSDGQGGMATATVTITVLQTGVGCDLYPIALHADTLANAQPGDILDDILNGEQAGNFGWLTWNGNNSTPSLIASLTPPGNSSSYTNPNDPADHTVSAGDWVEGKPGVSNAQAIRDALDLLEMMEIVVPVWDISQGNGANAVYHITGFASVRILDYQLAGQDSMTVEFLGFTTCQ